MASLTACSISHSVQRLLQTLQAEARVLAVWERACAFLTAAGDVVGLVAPDVGDGTLNVIVGAKPGQFRAIALGSPVAIEG